MNKKISLFLVLVMLCAFTTQTFGAELVEVNKTNEDDFKQKNVKIYESAGGMIEKGSILVDNIKVDYTRIDKKDGTIVIKGIENGKKQKVIISSDKKTLNFNGEVIKLKDISFNEFSKERQFRSKNYRVNTRGSEDWEYYGFRSGNTVIDSAIQSSVIGIAGLIIASCGIPGGYKLTMDSAIIIASAVVNTNAALNNIYYSVWIFRNSNNAPSPYPYVDKIIVNYYYDDDKTDRIESVEYLEYPLLP